MMNFISELLKKDKIIIFMIRAVLFGLLFYIVIGAYHFYKDPDFLTKLIKAYKSESASTAENGVSTVPPVGNYITQHIYTQPYQDKNQISSNTVNDKSQDSTNYKSQVDILNSKIASYESQIKILSQDNSKLRQEFAILKQKISSQDKNINSLNQDIKKYKKYIAELEQEILSRDKIIESQRRELVSIKIALDK